LTSTGSILGGGAGYTIGTVTGTSNGGAISLFDSTHGNTVNVLNNGAIVSQFTSTGLTVTGSITPSYPAGVVGNKTGANVTAGSVGEYICAQVTNGGSPTGCASNVSTPISLTSGTTINVASISLTAGDWDVSAHVAYILGGTTTVSFIGGSISTTSATNDYTKGFLGSFPGGSTTTTVATGISPVRINVSSPTTVYLVTVAVFGTSTMTVVGDISARRR
jgi:hypothetical protein